MLGIHQYVWRLVPANPILLRVVESGGKRQRDMFVRCGYLGLLIAWVIFALLSSGGSGTSSLGELAATSAKIFQQMSFIQLAMVSLLAPIFTAGAITQEKDSQTYDILLSTPLTNGQIVLGSLLSRLFFVIALLISGIPIFSITQIFGGVAISSIVTSFMIAAATAFVTGALAMAIATLKVGTRRTIFSFYLFIVLYLVGTFLLDELSYFKIPLIEADGSTSLSSTSWFTGLNPFLALQVVFASSEYLPPELGSLPAGLKSWPWGWYLTRPAHFYVSFMFFLSFILVLPSIALLRRLAQSTTSLKSQLLQKLKISSGDRTRKPRLVWGNPIAWREAKTKASAARASVLRYGFILAGITGAMTLVILYSQQEITGQYISSGSFDSLKQTLAVIEGDSAQTYRIAPSTLITFNGQEAGRELLFGELAVRQITTPTPQGRILSSIDLTDIKRTLSAASARSFLLGAVIIEFAVILLIITNAAASTVTREKEDGTLDLLLSTPITSRYYIWGKLRGLVSYVLPLVAVPVASALIFIFYDFFRRLGGSDAGFHWIIFPESLLIMPGLLIMVAAFASMVGMQMSLRCRTTVRAVMSSIGIVLGICAALGWCGFASLTGLRGGGFFGLMIASFSPFTVLMVLIDPMQFGGGPFQSTPEEIAGARLTVLIFSWIATGIYGAVVWSMYKSMVKNFDMTIRKQSR